MNETRNHLFDRALVLKSMVTDLATGEEMDDDLYRSIRSRFVEDPSIRAHVPQFMSDGIWSYMKGVHTGSGAYAARRTHIDEQFGPFLDALLSSAAPADLDVSQALERYDSAVVGDVWRKALARRETDPEGAITAARTLLEEVCKHILEDAGTTPGEKWDLPKLYAEAAKLMHLAPSQHTEDAFRRILGSSQSVVEGLGSLRNKISDAHGGGRRRIRPADRHAALAVNLSGSMAMFLIETWQAQRDDHSGSSPTR